MPMQSDMTFNDNDDDSGNFDVIILLNIYRVYIFIYITKNIIFPELC